jgi:uncharacterized protein (DUF427 family)
MKIVWNDQIIGESEDVLILGNEYYFLEDDVDMSLLIKNADVLHCPDKGYATCYDINVGSSKDRSGAWSYPHPYPTAKELMGRIGVKKTKIILL